MTIDKEYYSDNTRISNSAIGWFLKKGPQYLKGMLDGTEEGISGKFLEKGTMIHMYLLQPEEFWQNYIILDFEIPKSKQQKDALEYYNQSMKVNPLESQDKLKMDAYKSAYSNKKTDDQCIKEMEDLILYYQDYLQYLTETEKKTVISFADLNMLKNIKNNIDNHKMAIELLTDILGCESYNEFHINWEDKKNDLKCKSLLDRVVFDHINKKVTLIDLKTTSDIYNFKHSVDEYDYYRQIAFYLLAITWYLTDIGVDAAEYDCEAYIIAIQSNGSNEVKVFNMLNEKELLDRKDLISNTLTEISYHYKTGNWYHTRKYYEGNGTEELK